MLHRSRILWCVAFLAFCSIAGGVEFTYPKGARISSLSDWPQGLHRCANVASRIYGHSINSNDFHYYSGDVAEFNRFMEEYSKIDLYRYDVELLPGKGEIEVNVEKDKGQVKLPYDWKLSIRPGGGPKKAKYHATASVYLSGPINRDKLKIPAHIQVDDQTKRGAQSTLD